MAPLGTLALFATLAGATTPGPQPPAQSPRVRVTLAAAVELSASATAGQRVETLLPGQPVAGTLVGASPDELLLRLDKGGRVARIPRAALARTELSKGRRRWAWGLGGAVIGGAVGMMAASSTGSTPRRGRQTYSGVGCGMPLCDFGPALGEAVGAAMDDVRRAQTGLLAGAALGAIFGSAVAPERWKPAERLEAGLSIAPTSRGAAVALSLRF